MATSMTAEDIDHPRRRFLGIMAATIAAADLGIVAAADAQSDSVVRPSVTSGAITSFRPLKQINAGLLNVGYAEAGPNRWPGGHPAARLAL